MGLDEVEKICKYCRVSGVQDLGYFVGLNPKPGLRTVECLGFKV